MDALDEVVRTEGSLDYSRPVVAAALRDAGLDIAADVVDAPLDGEMEYAKLRDAGGKCQKWFTRAAADPHSVSLPHG